MQQDVAALHVRDGEQPIHGDEAFLKPVVAGDIDRCANTCGKADAVRGSDLGSAQRGGAVADVGLHEVFRGAAAAGRRYFLDLFGEADDPHAVDAGSGPAYEAAFGHGAGGGISAHEVPLPGIELPPGARRDALRPVEASVLGAVQTVTESARVHDGCEKFSVFQHEV